MRFVLIHVIVYKNYPALSLLSHSGRPGLSQLWAGLGCTPSKASGLLTAAEHTFYQGEYREIFAISPKQSPQSTLRKSLPQF